MAYLDNNGVTYLWNKIKALFNKGITNLSVNGRTITFTKGDGTTGTINTQDTNTTYGNFKGATASADGGSGLVPAPTKGNEGKYLKADGTWGTPANTTYADMKGATSSAAGTHGLVPAPAAGKQSQYLRGDGTWATPTNTTYSDATQSAHGLMSAADKVKLDGVETNANNYVHPTTSGNKHIPSGGSSGQILRWSADGTAVWGSDNNTTYSDATQSAHGLMSVNDKKKLDAYPAYSTIQSTYATKSEITNMYKYCGSVASSDKLPTTGQRVGDVYNIEAASKYGGAGMNVAWNGSAWDPLGEIFTITAITNAEIDTICV